MSDLGKALSVIITLYPQLKALLDEAAKDSGVPITAEIERRLYMSFGLPPLKTGRPI